MKLTSCCLIAIALFASQHIFAQTDVGFRLGYLRSKVNISNFVGQEFLGEPEWVSGARGGFFFETRLVDRLYLNPEIGFVSKGGEYTPSMMTIGKVSSTVSYRTKQFYAELPVNLLYKLPVNQNGNILVAAGGVLGAFIAGKIEYESIKKTETSINLNNFRSRQGIYEKYEAGLNFALGYEHKLLRAIINVRPDFPDVNKVADIVQRNFYVGFNLGFCFTR